MQIWRGRTWEAFGCSVCDGLLITSASSHLSCPALLDVCPLEGPLRPGRETGGKREEGRGRREEGGGGEEEREGGDREEGGEREEGVEGGGGNNKRNVNIVVQIYYSAAIEIKTDNTIDTYYGQLFPFANWNTDKQYKHTAVSPYKLKFKA